MYLVATTSEQPPEILGGANDARRTRRGVGRVGRHKAVGFGNREGLREEVPALLVIRGPVVGERLLEGPPVAYRDVPLEAKVSDPGLRRRVDDPLDHF